MNNVFFQIRLPYFLKSFTLLAVVLIVGCNSSQPTGPTGKQADTHFSAVGLDFHNIIGLVHHSTHGFGHPYDTTYDSKDTLRRAFYFIPRSASYIDNLGRSDQRYDTSSSHSDPSGDASASTSYSATFTLDTANKRFSSFVFKYKNSSYSDGGSCLGCPRNSSGENWHLQLGAVSWDSSTDSTIDATVSPDRLSVVVDSIEMSGSQSSSTPNGGYGTSTKLLQLQLPAPDSYIRITLQRK